MKIRFYERRGFLGYLVWLGGSKFYHVDCEQNGTCFDCRPGGTKMWYDSKPFTLGPVVDSKINGLAWALDHGKEKYSYWTCLLLFLRIKRDPPGMVCSEYVQRMLGIDGPVLTPEQLYERIK